MPMEIYVSTKKDLLHEIELSVFQLQRLLASVDEININEVPYPNSWTSRTINNTCFDVYLWNGEGNANTDKNRRS